MTDLSPTTAEEREKRLAWMNRMDAKPIIVDRVFERRLIKDVERLERQLGDELAADSVLCPHAPKHILEAKCKELEVSLKSTGCCVVCWTTSWEPVENEEDCTIAEHPHPEEGCLRCGHCAVLTSYKALESGLEDAEAEVEWLVAERGCPTCAHCQLKRGGHLD